MRDKLGRADVPSGAPIGESWDIVDRDEAQSINKDEVSLRELLLEFPEAIMGVGWLPEWRFPILLKWLDCNARLSLQVHPPQEVAERLCAQPKTECWYFADTEPGAKVFAGLKAGVTVDEFEAAMNGYDVEALVHAMSPQKGDAIFIPSGRIHAIGGGNLILEIQQNSDTTYRVYDWGRLGLDGRPRQLHIQESLQSIDFEDCEPELLKPVGSEQVITSNNCFDLIRKNLEPGDTLDLKAGQPRIVSLVSGAVSGTGDLRLTKGESALFPACADHELAATEPTVLLVTENFNKPPID
ncbi:MAG: type I phosphomannose isomerase catalytic subunit [Lentimonas sp.]